MIFLNFTNSPSAIDGQIDQAATVAGFVAKYPGFPGYVYANPDQRGSSGDGMGYPHDIYGPNWKAACAHAKGAGGVLVPRIGGCATHDLPMSPTGAILQGRVNTLFAKFRPSPFVIGDYASGQDAEAECRAYMEAARFNQQTFAPEANAKRTWVAPDVDVWICAEWFLWDIAVTGAVSGWDHRRWKLADWLAAHPQTKAIVEINSIERRGNGFENGIADWPGKKVELALMYHAIDPERVIVSVRATGITDDGIEKLRRANK